ncbi:uncharacterized protein ISCGN_028523 [Ixodes scapularis]
MPPKTPAPVSRLSDDEEDISAIINEAIAGHTRSLREAMQDDRSSMLQALRQERTAMQESLIVALQQLFPRTTAPVPPHPDTTQGLPQSGQSASQPLQPHPSTSTYTGPTQPTSGYTLQSALGGYEANPNAQAAAFGQPPTQPAFQPPLGPPHPFPPPTPIELPVYGQQAPRQRVFTVHDLPTRRDLGEAFIHVQNANRSTQLLSKRDIIELQLLESFLEVWDSYPPLAPQSRLRVFDRVRLLYHVATSGWNTALDGYADPSASYLLGPPARRTEQPQRGASPTRPRKNPGRQSRKDNPKRNQPKEDNPSPNKSTTSPSQSPRKSTPIKSARTASCGSVLQDAGQTMKDVRLKPEAVPSLRSPLTGKPPFSPAEDPASKRQRTLDDDPVEEMDCFVDQTPREQMPREGRCHFRHRASTSDAALQVDPPTARDAAVQTCYSSCTVSMKVRGTLLTVRTCCPAKHTHRWDSQPCIKRRAVGDLLLSSLVLFTGASPTRTLRLWRLMNIQVICRKTFFNYQRAILIPAVEQNANRSTQLLSKRDIIELQLLESFLEVWDSYPPLAPQSRLRVFDRVRLLYHVATSGWNTALDGYADPSASYLLGPPARRTEQPQRGASPTRPRKNPGRQSRKDNPKRNQPKEDKFQSLLQSPPRSLAPPERTRVTSPEPATAGELTGHPVSHPDPNQGSPTRGPSPQPQLPPVAAPLPPPVIPTPVEIQGLKDYLKAPEGTPLHLNCVLSDPRPQWLVVNHQPTLVLVQDVVAEDDILAQALNIAGIVPQLQPQQVLHQPQPEPEEVDTHQVWKGEQGMLLEELRDQPLDLAGDGRCDSPGYSAKYLTYSLHVPLVNKILHCEQVQVGGSGIANALDRSEKSDLHEQLSNIGGKDIPDSKEVIAEAIACGVKGSRKKLRSAAFEAVEKALFTMFLDTRAANVPRFKECHNIVSKVINAPLTPALPAAPWGPAPDVPDLMRDHGDDRTTPLLGGRIAGAMVEHGRPRGHRRRGPPPAAQRTSLGATTSGQATSGQANAGHSSAIDSIPRTDVRRK